MALSPAQRHSQRIAMEQKLKRSQALETTESMHLLIKALETDVEHARYPHRRYSHHAAGAGKGYPATVSRLYRSGDAGR